MFNTVHLKNACYLRVILIQPMKKQTHRTSPSRCTGNQTNIPAQKYEQKLKFTVGDSSSSWLTFTVGDGSLVTDLIRIIYYPQLSGSSSWKQGG